MAKMGPRTDAMDYVSLKQHRDFVTWTGQAFIHMT